MKTSNIAIIIPAIVLPLFLTSCMGDFLQPREDPTVFYMLKAESTRAPAKVDSAPLQVNLLPITIPSYMARPQIVSLASGDRVDMSEFNRWSELPNDAITRIMVQNLSVLNHGIVDLYAYPAVAVDPNAPALKITITECIGKLGGELSLKGKWRIIPANDDEIFQSKMFAINIPCEDSYDSYVSAMSAAFVQMAKQISEGLNEYKNKIAAKSTADKK